MGSRFNGKIGKVPSFGEKRDSKRVSPRVAKDPFAEKTGMDEYKDPPFLYDSDTGTGNPKQPGEVDLYSPETVSQYKSQWARYERGLELMPAAIQPDGRHLLYKFQSNNAIDGYWQVRVRPGASFLNITKPEFQILCPRPTQLTVVESDGESFTWEQIKGSRSAQLTNPTTINPILDILSYCDGNGCYDGSVEPIVLKVQPLKQPELFDTITIYTTPTSTHYGNSFERAIAATDFDPARRVTQLSAGVSLPLYLQRGYQANPLNTLMVTWSLPATGLEFLTHTEWQENTTGQYLKVQEFAVNELRLITLQTNRHYRIVSKFNTFSRTSSIESQRFYNVSPNRVVAADDSLDGLSFTKSKSSLTVLPLARKGLEVTDNFDGLAYSNLKSSINSLPLGAFRLEVNPDIHDGVSFALLKSGVTKTNLGGMVIR